MHTSSANCGGKLQGCCIRYVVRKPNDPCCFLSQYPAPQPPSKGYVRHLSPAAAALERATPALERATPAQKRATPALNGATPALRLMSE